ncbi:MAG TPA: hypothetical protein VD968_07595 [Pyrinomonadaceae bacterium]|nr:hypothetical protein [Pyrinomonadaceae bacterium]
MKLSRTSTVTLLLLLVATSAGCGVINRIRAKNALNEGARAYREGQFTQAEEKFRRAFELDPTQKNAPLFIARAVQQQYKPGVASPENVATGQRAIQAYQDILNRDPRNEDAYKAIVFLYGQMKEEDKVRQMLTQRASMTDIPESKRAEALTILASKQWQCSYDTTEQKDNKTTEGNVVKYKKPANQADFDKAKGCVAEGMRLVEQAISLDQNNANAWSYKANLLREQSKLAEMDGNAQQKQEFDRLYDQARETHARLSEEAQKRKEAEEAAKSPTPPAS